MNKKIFSCAITFIVINLIFCNTNIKAQINESHQNINTYLPINFKQPEPPPDAPKTGRAKGGGSRGQCSFANSKLQQELTLTSLLPANGWGLTVSESPTLWIYISYPSDEFDDKTSLKAELSVEERKTDLKLEPKSYSFELPTSSGIFSIALPHALESNKWYRWYLVVNCQTENLSENDVLQIEGFLYKKEPNNLTNYSESLKELELVNFYINNHIWYDAFNEAALFHCDNSPDNELSNYWQTLLTSDEIELAEISNRSIICPN